MSAAESPLADQAALADVGAFVRERLCADPSAWRVPVEKAEIFAIADFLSEPECAHMIAMIDSVAKPSPVFDQAYAGTYRTSYSGDVDTSDSFVRMIERRLCDVIGLDLAWGETMQGQRYHPGQEFKGHYDFFDTSAFYWADEIKRGGQRSWTAMVYLNDVEEGGETRFSRIDVSVPPQRGALLIWNNAQADGRPNPLTLHAATPVIRGVKYVITKWFRTRPWS